MTSTGEHGRGRRTWYRPTKAEIEVRVTEIFKLLMAGAQRHDIRRYVAEKTKWEVPERTLDRYVARATACLRTHAAAVRDEELGLAILQLKDLYGRTYRIQDYKTSLAARKELSELLGLYAPKRVALTDPEGGPQSFIAIMPERAKDNASWSEKCKKEREELDRLQATDSTASGGQ